MLNEITWTEYGAAIGAALAAYYLYVWWRYGKQKKSGSPNREVLDDDEPYEIDEFNAAPHAGEKDDADAMEILGLKEEDFEQADQLMDSIRSAISIAAGKQSGKQEICEQIRSLLACYPTLNIPAFRPGINYEIITELNEKCSVMLAEREVDGLW